MLNQNRPLKAELILNFGNQANAAAALELPEYRLSRIINGRIVASSKDRDAFVRALGAEKVAALLGGNDRPEAS
jgi:hypothetical protein